MNTSGFGDISILNTSHQVFGLNSNSAKKKSSKPSNNVHISAGIPSGGRHSNPTQHISSHN